jgi:predicted oxidoreductase
MNQNIKIAKDLDLSRITSGMWRLAEWKMTDKQVLEFIEQSIELGVNTFDHADIYGDYSCETLFGRALSLNPSIRNNIRLITKCGIKLVSDKYPNRKIKYYDYSYGHILTSVENSLVNLRTGYIDLLLLHRPSPFFDVEEVVKAFERLKESGKVLHFGVSNFTPQQFRMLETHLPFKLVTNQVEISPLYLEQFEDGSMDFYQDKKIHPMAWSPLGGGRLMNPKDKRSKRVSEALSEVAKELEVDQVDKIAYAWLLKHPSGIIPITGTGKIKRIRQATESLNINMSLEQWFRIYIASAGRELP